MNEVALSNPLESVLLANPWREFAGEALPHILPADESIIREFNRKCNNAAHKIQLNVYPEPFIGDPNAPVLLLNLNPGYSDDTPTVHASSAVAKTILDNLHHCTSECPFYPLRSAYRENGGSSWWEKSLGGWIAEFGVPRVSRCFFCIEYFPYASRKYREFGRVLPS